MKDTTQFIDASFFWTKRQSKSDLYFRSRKSEICFPKQISSFKLLSLLDSSLRSGVTLIINSYQRHLSPKKGYSCAHRLVYGGDSCSQYVKKTLTNKNLFEATVLAKRRFGECNIARLSAKKQFVESNNMVSVGGPDDPIILIIQFIIGIIAAILALIFGKNNGCCK